MASGAQKSTNTSRKAEVPTSSDSIISLWFPRSLSERSDLAYPVPVAGFAVLTLSRQSYAGVGGKDHQDRDTSYS